MSNLAFASFSLCLLLLVACSASVALPPVPDRSTCRVCLLPLQAGMKRSDVEQKVAALLEKPSAYSAYGNNLRGGIVEYRDAAWLLRVTYAAGTPAPWVIGPTGVAEHWPPKDETVLSYEIVQAPASSTGR